MWYIVLYSVLTVLPIRHPEALFWDVFLFPNPKVLRFRVWVSGFKDQKLELKTRFKVILKLADL